MVYICIWFNNFRSSAFINEWGGVFVLRQSAERCTDIRFRSFRSCSSVQFILSSYCLVNSIIKKNINNHKYLP